MQQIIIKQKISLVCSIYIINAGVIGLVHSITLTYHFSARDQNEGLIPYKRRTFSTVVLVFSHSRCCKA